MSLVDPDRHAADRQPRRLVERHDLVGDQVGLLAARPAVDRARHEHDPLGLDQFAEPGVVLRPADHPHESFHVLQIEHRVAGVGRAVPRLLDVGKLDRRDEAADDHLALGLDPGEVGCGMGANRTQQ